MIYAATVFLVGLSLSAFFSGVETGFYRAPRLRLVIDAVGGSRTARGLLWASNHPEAFVATALVGNNVANYLASSAVVAASIALFPAAGIAGEIGLTLLVAPVVFVFGELLPKRAFLQAPYGLLRAVGGPLLLAGVALAVPSSLLWLAGRTLSVLTGARVQPLRMAVRRRELTDAFAEGEAVGLLSSAQRDLALATFAVSGAPLRDFMTPAGRQPRIAAGASKDDVVLLARRHRQDALPVTPEAVEGRRDLFVRASRVLTRSASEPGLPTEAMARLRDSTPFLQALTTLESSGQPIAVVVDAAGRLVGYARLDALQQALWDAA